MPELPEVETSKRYIEQFLLNAKILNIQTSVSKLRWEINPNINFLELNDSILSKHSDIQVKQDGGANTRRPLVFTDIGALIKGRDLQIGNLITDVTVSGDGEPYYLSLKFGITKKKLKKNLHIYQAIGKKEATKNSTKKSRK